MDTKYRGLSDWEFVLLKELVASKISFEVKLKHHKEKYLGGSVSIKPTKNEGYYWNKSQFTEILDLLQQVGSEYNRVGVPENMIHSVFSNGCSHLRFRVDESNRLFFPGLVPNICIKHACFGTRSAAEKYQEKNRGNLSAELFIGVHPKDGFVVYSASKDCMKMGNWEVSTKAELHLADIWSKGYLSYRTRAESLITGFTPVTGVDEEDIEFTYDGIMVYTYFRATGTELVEEREFLPWFGEEVRNVDISYDLIAAAEKLLEQYPPLLLEPALS
ncbi:hypothetical protein [Paenibacillus taichungensis]